MGTNFSSDGFEPKYKARFGDYVSRSMKLGLTAASDAAIAVGCYVSYSSLADNENFGSLVTAIGLLTILEGFAFGVSFYRVDVFDTKERNANRVSFGNKYLEAHSRFYEPIDSKIKGIKKRLLDIDSNSLDEGL